MQTAIYNDPNGEKKPVRAETFQHDPKLSIKRKLLLCAGCGIKAAFRRKSVNGKAAHFAASHRTGCDIPDDDTTEIYEASEYQSVDELKNEEGLIEIDLSFGGRVHRHGQEPKTDDYDPGDDKRSRKKHGGTDNTGKSSWRRRLSTLLKTLFEDESFSRSAQLMLMPNGKKYKASTVFYPIEAVERFKEYGKYPAFYFGIIDSAVLSKGVLWLNTGTLEGTSVKIYDEATITNLLSRYKLTVDNEQFEEISILAGAQFLVYGWFNNAKSGKKIITPAKDFDANAICLRKRSNIKR